MTMIIPKDAIIAVEKMRDYLLKPLEIDDKSGFLELAGYTREDHIRLLDDIREQLLPGEGQLQMSTPFGDRFELDGRLRGPSGEPLFIRTIWQRSPKGTWSFITLFPNTKGRTYEL
ncbi:MAG TPA: hypothetical protein VG537_02760 [Candidatus Kapabacteria bacterium]|jgi:hypothetical protein|nr:hypothetical protein [Candidatus Kapabacteria bacterium]